MVNEKTRPFTERESDLVFEAVALGNLVGRINDRLGIDPPYFEATDGVSVLVYVAGKEYKIHTAQELGWAERAVRNRYNELVREDDST